LKSSGARSSMPRACVSSGRCRGPRN
jgi:hypothetical protein